MLATACNSNNRILVNKKTKLHIYIKRKIFYIRESSSKMRKVVGFLGGCLSGRQAGRPRARLFVDEKYQQGRKGILNSKIFSMRHDLIVENSL